MAKNTGNSERDDLTSLVRAHLEWEREWNGAPGIPHVSVQPATRAVISVVQASPTLVESQPKSAPSLDLPERHRRLEIAQNEAAGCVACRLHETRTKSVFARGNPMSPLVFVGEGPGRNEDLQGLPFVGEAGQLLDRMIGAMGYARDEVYICNVVKCRPPENRKPQPDEAEACSPFLATQLETIAPRVIVALGKTAGEGLGCFPPSHHAGNWRGVWSKWRDIPVMPTYHPAYLLRSPEHKKPVWEDLQKVMAFLRTT